MTLQKLVSVFRETLADDRLTLRPEMSPDDTPGWDSFTHVSLVVGIEEAFDVMLSVDEIGRLVSVGDIVQVLGEKGIDITWDTPG